MFEKQRRIETLESWIEEQDDAMVGLYQQINTANSRAKKMEIARSEEGVDQISLKVALEIEDLFVQSHFGGREQRLEKIQIKIRDEMQKMLVGTTS